MSGSLDDVDANVGIVGANLGGAGNVNDVVVLAPDQLAGDRNLP